MDEQPEVERSVEIDATPEEIWERITDGELAEEWLGVTIAPRPGGPVTVPGEDTIGTVEEVDPDRSITWSWRQPDGDPSQVTIAIEPTPGGSRVTIVERLLEYRITGAPPTFLAQAA
ncbi:MAG: SRPBCC domain-containing protein [Actinomycetota bacterium]